MTELESFRDLLRRVRQRDPVAAEEIFRRYEAQLRRYIRLRLTDPRMYRVFDSMDIFQSVLANFFVRMAAGQFELEKPAQLVALLTRMSHNKVIDHLKNQENGRRLEPGSHLHAQAADNGASPSRIVICREMLDKVLGGMKEKEQKIALLRAEHLSWKDVGAAVGMTDEAARKLLTRALDRVCLELDLDRSAVLS